LLSDGFDDCFNGLGLTGAGVYASVATSSGMSRWCLMRRNRLSATSIAAAVQRRTIAASFQFFTLRWVVRAMEIMLSTRWWWSACVRDWQTARAGGR
jgi:hypothetical protein